ncbi:E3 ubiquitin-protein ligase XB3-like protein [Emericellopsis cladophorae]|uniref:E3 ubiquitin-protein ligase XB3-like protein n=1 Tax=Emericellopsis cladophorae TaxID=2686198 RepID=A0A9Q0BBV9_9HYPO|nr:E3 ubiquitin-protein ligase XB3-like protein [Emericellopsis cladophorae]KAI6779722.1 E3 ubiquitin-protein ligase XB3-like protein [Emericellopsis cladophorae]
MTAESPYTPLALRDDLRHLQELWRNTGRLCETSNSTVDILPQATKGIASILEIIVSPLELLPLKGDQDDENDGPNLLAGRPRFLQGLFDLETRISTSARRGHLNDELSMCLVPNVYWYHLKLVSASHSQDCDELAYKLSLLPQAPSPDFLATAPPPLEILRWHQTFPGSSYNEGEWDLQVYYANLLTASFNHHVPRLYAEECLWADLRNAMVPAYEGAATDCFLHGEPRADTFGLFHTQGQPYSYKLYQWLLQWGRLAISSESARYHSGVFHLADSLRTGKVTALHVAAVLGFPVVCRQLLEAGYSPNQRSPWGPPLHCVLAGFSSWEALYEFSESGKGLFPRTPSAQRTDAVKALLDAGASGASAAAPGQRGHSLAAYAIAFSLEVEGDEQVLRKVVDGGACLDEYVAGSLMKYCTTKPMPFSKTLIARVLTYLHGVLIVREGTLLLGTPALVLGAIETVMAVQAVSFDIGEYPDPLRTLSTPPRGAKRPVETFEQVVRKAILDASAFHLRRLMIDPHFDIVLHNPTGEPFLHTAVSSGEKEIVELLLAAGADVECRDEESRTPIMVVESSEMLSLLVKGHGALTTATEDNGGRNIWHMAAATGAISLLDWLLNNDPHKVENMRAVSKKGRTPLAEAFFMSEEQKNHDLAGTTPQAACLLLDDPDMEAEIISGTTRPLTHLAAAWGDIDVINGLGKLGADFSAVDLQGRSAMQYLKLSAHADVVERLRELGAESRMDMAAKAQLPIDVFRQACPYQEVCGEGHSLELIAESKDLAMPRFGYDALLTSDVVAFIDADGQTLLERYVRNIWAAEPEEARNILASNQESRNLARFIAIRFLGGVSSLAGKGCITEHETHRQQCGLYGFMVPSCGSSPLMNKLLAPRIVDIVYKYGNRDYFAEFCRRNPDDIVTQIMEHLYSYQEWRQMGILFEAGYVPPERCEYRFAKMGVPGLLKIDRHVNGAGFRGVLTVIDADALNASHRRIVDMLSAARLMKDPVDKFWALQDRGLVLPREGEHGLDSLVRRLFSNLSGRLDAHLVLCLLDMGAEPRVDEQDITAARQAVMCDHLLVLQKLVTLYGPEFPWHQPTGTYLYKGSNILCDAVTKAPWDVVEFLLANTSAKRLINTEIHGATPLHVAAGKGYQGIDTLLCLRRHGADDAAVDEDGRTWMEILAEYSDLNPSAASEVLAERLCEKYFDEADLPVVEMKRLLEQAGSRRAAAGHEGGSMAE